MAFNEDGYPMFYVFKNCKSFIRTIPTLTCDEHRPEDVATEGEDHEADQFRYVCMGRPIAPRVAHRPDKYNETPMAMYLDIPKEDIIARPKRARMEVISGNKEES